MRSAGLRTQAVTKTARAQIEVVAEVLEGYARRGVFRGFSRGQVGRGEATFRITWHWNRVFDLVFDLEKRALRCGKVLCNVPADSTMYRELKEFIRSRHGDDVVEHRRIDRQMAPMKVVNRGGNISLVLRVKGSDCEYGARKFVHLMNEIFVTFLADGNYFEYLVEAFDLDPDAM